jgi:hypothetical protein
MNNNKLKNTTSAMFIAAVLVAGTFAMVSPLTVYAQQYGQDSYYPSDPGTNDKSHSKQSQKANCDNKNINVNGVEQRLVQDQLVESTLAGSPEGASIAGEELTPEEAFAAMNGNGDPLINAERNILNVCFNDNDNDLSGTFTGTQTQTGGSTTNPPPVVGDPCVTCLEPFRVSIEAFLATITPTTERPLPGTGLTLTADIDTLEDFCALFGAGISLNITNLVALQAFIAGIAGIGLPNAVIILSCLIANGVITVLQV